MRQKQGQSRKKNTDRKKSDYSGRDTFNNKKNRGSGRGRGGGGSGRRNDNQGPPLPNLKVFNKPEKKGFRAIPIIPTKEEILAPRPEDIPENIINGPYESIDKYLETHYKLLREDCVRPLREGIQHLKSQTENQSQSEIDASQTEKQQIINIQFQIDAKQSEIKAIEADIKYASNKKEAITLKEQISDLKAQIGNLQNQLKELIRPNLRVYERIDLVGISFTNMGVIHRISFVTKHGERVNWSSSKRLLPGTLVVFSKDNFNTLKFGTVANRPIELLEKTYDLQIDVLFQHEDVEFEWSEGYIMVEATSSYFEAYRHVLNVLQELEPEELPFKEQIVELNKEISTPEYLQIRHPFYEFKTMQPHGTLSFDITGEWPQMEKINPELHESQYDALKRMLTHRLALVQGPPGTGKTYIGLEAVEILLKNLPGTIIITCQTNHALDQFLEGIQEFEEGIVRLGSRSKSHKIKQRTLYNIRQESKSSESRPRNMGLIRLFKERDEIVERMDKLCEKIRSPFLGLDFIRKNNCLTEDQITSLKQDDWFMSSSSDDNGDENRYIQEWLESSIATTTSKQNDLDYQVDQLILQDSGNYPEEDDEVDDEEQIKEAEEEYQADGNQFTNDKIRFVPLRSEKCIRSDVYVSDGTIKEYKDSENLWEIPQEVRVAMHNRWRRKSVEDTCKELKSLCIKYSELTDRIKAERIREDLLILQSARVVGMTTTAAAKYHKLLMNLEPKIMIIEEAAETLEAHIVTALTPATQHLILIGDHQQLRPNISVHELESKNLNVSLFERLTENNLPFSMLIEQRRMRPIIRELLTPIYKDRLIDHGSVCEYPDVPGVYDDLFFFDHLEEESHIAETMSKYNDFEARMCVKFAMYLMNGGMVASRITILSMYSGQRKQIYRYLREDSRGLPDLKSIRVSSVDGFQGEQNDIILLSLVRSKERSGIGFLGVSNRVCVALSRAKHGLYIFGNASQLAERSPLWKDVIDILNKKRCIGQSMELYCQKHSDKEKGHMVNTEVFSYCDFPPGGGCSRICGDIMECGHVCQNKCHLSEHDPMICQENCIRSLPCGHPCNEQCSEPCGKCERTFTINPPCGHSKEISCSMENGYRCMQRCEKRLNCGHHCQDVCSSPWCTPTCRAPITIKLPCGHPTKTLCFKRVNFQEDCPHCKKM